MLKDNSVPLSGRFGNQIFQLCAAIYLSKSRKEPLAINGKLTRPKNLKLLVNSGLVSSNELQLNTLQMLYLKNSMIGDIYDKWIALKYFLIYKAERRFKNFKIPKISNKYLYLKDESWRTINTLKHQYYGYFQDANLVEEVWPDLCKRLTTSNLIPEIRLPEDTAVIHIRLTDYLIHPEIGSLSEEYYLQCMKITNAKIYYVVTDDVPTFKRKFPSIAKIAIVYEFSDDPFKSFKFLVSSRKIILANSTFSYWAGVFSLMLDEKSVIVSPDPWRKDGKNQSILSKKFILHPSLM